MWLRADNSGFDAYLDGVYLGKNTDVIEAWTNNAAELWFAASPPFANLGRCTLHEVALYGRILTEAEILVLARASSLPVANGDNASVLESATTPIEVLPNDSFVGGTPTISIVAPPGGGDSVAVNGSAINYTAGAVSADTERTFQYRITDPNGQSNTATVRVTVQNAVRRKSATPTASP